VSEATFSLTMTVTEVGTQTMPSGATKRLLRGTIAGTYPQHYEVDCWGKDVRDSLAAIGVGQTVKVVGELRGRLHAASGRIYHSLAAEHVMVVGGDAVEPAGAHAEGKPDEEDQGQLVQDDMPF